MKRFLPVLFSFVFLLILVSTGSWAGLSGELRQVVTSTDLDDPSGRSYLTTGTDITTELDLKWKELIDKRMRFEGVLNIRATDDERIDPETWSIEKLYVKLAGKKFGLTVGDFYGDFSQYSLIQSLKGVDYYRKIDFGRGLKLNGIFGVTQSRWEWMTLDLRDDQRNVIEKPTRYVTGLRAEQKITKKIGVGLNFVNSKDDPSEVFGTTDGTACIDNRVLGVDTNMKLGRRLRIKSEFATSWNDENIEDNTTGTITGNAFRLDSRYRYKKLRLRAKYEEVEPDFVTPGGSATLDRREYRGSLDYRHSRQFSTELKYRKYRNNLEGQLTTTTKTTVPEVRFTIRPVKRLKALKLDLGYKRRYRAKENNSTDQLTKTTEIDLRHKIGGLNLQTGWEHEKKEDYVDPNDRRKRVKKSFGVGSSFELGQVELLPSVRYELEWYKEFTNFTEDKSKTARFSTRLRFPGDTDLYLGHKIVSKDRAGTENDSFSTTSSIKLRHRIGGDPDKLASLSFKQRYYKYYDSTDDYTENVTTGSLTYRF